MTTQDIHPGRVPGGDTQARTVADIIAATPEAARTTPQRETCANCATPLIGRYCHNCTQSSVRASFGVREGLWNLLYMYTKIDHKLLRTLKVMLLAPGKVSLDYRNGIDVPYTPPFRLNILLGVLVLLVLLLSGVKFGQTVFKYEPGAQVTRDAEGAPALLNVEEQIILVGLQAKRPPPPPEFLASLERELAREEKDRFAAWLDRAQLRYWRAVANGDPTLANWNNLLPFFYIATAPLFALLLALFFRACRFPLGDHLVFAFHIHAFALLLMLVVVPVVYLWPYAASPGVFDIDDIALNFWCVLVVAYVVFAVRTFYSATWLSAVFKGVPLGVFDVFLVLLPFAFTMGLEFVRH